MQYDWDKTKRLWTLAHRSIDFESVERFIWESANIVPDDRNEYGEARFVATGFIDNRLHVMAFTMRSDVVRIISLRKANERERKAYEKK